ncbi:CDP-alcohol phosphatidyltransferase family protein [uncultured Pseudokineococcus sp.]|uniref:CDP-alcohol phosphatidyltransferase family protein n=1 Tax=uncultured Pseudokineococcus sp. TaxID=1642928 RepID=UPI00260724DC|nr:CDP-alcohol phosphatidyltransferase family protein [uncultured Pseudokineococcus sp.]
MRARDLPDREEHLRRWAALHGAPVPTGLVRWWLSVVHALSLPLARAGVAPTALTAAGLLLPLAALPAAAAGGRWALLVPALVLVSGVVDSLDGGVAVLRGATSSWGAVADALADRLADALALAALWLLGAPGPVLVAAGALAALAEYARARGGAAGVQDVGVVTVGERPTRVLVVSAAALVAGSRPEQAGTWAAVGAWAALGVAVVALAQLLPVLRRQLRDLDRDSERDAGRETSGGGGGSA